MENVKVILCIGGSDSSSGAGIQADLATVGALGVYGLCAVTAIVAESPKEVRMVEAVRGELLREQIRVVRKDFPVDAIKIGLLSTVEQVMVLREELANFSGPIVLDPVMVASVGQALTDGDRVLEALQEVLLPRVSVITPNLQEARLLAAVQGELAEKEVAQMLAKKFGGACVLTGGHFVEQGICREWIAEGGKVESVAGEAIYGGASFHGTGCVFSSALATGLAQGLVLKEAVTKAKAFVVEAMKKSFAWDRGFRALGLQRLAGNAMENTCFREE